MKNVEDVYPLSAMQQLMLLHAISARRSEVLCEQLSCTLVGQVDTPALRRAWRSVIARHPVLRTGFVWEGLKQPLQIVRQHVELPWNEHDKAKAKKLLQEAGYKGEPVRFMTTQEYKWMYDFALVTKQQLEDVGFNIDLQVLDWATLVKRRNNPKEYEAFTTGTGMIYEPTAYTVLSCTWPGWTCAKL